MKPKILFLTKYGQKGASSRYRSIQYISYLESQGFNCIVSPLFDDGYLTNLYTLKRRKLIDLVSAFIRRIHILFTRLQFNLVVLEKELIPYIPAFLERLLNCKVPYIVDYDDAIFHNYNCHPNPIVRYILGDKIAKVMQYAQLVIVGNQYLAEYAQRSGAKAIEIIPTVVDLTRYSSKKNRKNNLFTIGWIGSLTTYRHIETIKPVLEQFCIKTNSKILLIGACQTALNEDWIDLRTWQANKEVDYLQECDVGIMPLIDEPFERGKCGLKLIQYMACSLPVIASPVGVNSDIVEHDKNGYLVSTAEEWKNALTTLQNDKSLCLRMGKQGRKKVEAHYCLQVIAPRLTHLFQKIIEEKI
ncbi:glycosyltransferase family 4 protein [Candidatus Parabeggiatoa sp. HSG14]|uniref:glycosyltransferase family 4 protein n=1 Tax=Candidatus Parabeggiatoa sp. HSG14 TaxID=3055593 RepID=UPI0025A7C500|nr:glycosyltransferase family 4 protein [Thiotrichales bacterium HSG14]